jgi:hypothetical protein
MEEIISTGMSIIIWTFGKVTTGLCPPAASVQVITGRSFTGKLCMTPVAMKPLVDTGNPG